MKKCGKIVFNIVKISSGLAKIMGNITVGDIPPIIISLVSDSESDKNSEKSDEEIEVLDEESEIITIMMDCD
jgi:hypothetical protein